MSLPRIEREGLARRGILAADYLAGTPAAVRLFEGRRALEATSASPAGGIEPGRRPARLSASAFVTTTPAAAARLSRILSGDGVLVTTGQQPLLFLGPLYTLYKACTAVRLARDIERATRRPALAVFWIASDDHDWVEVATTALVDREGVVHRYGIDAPREAVRCSVGPTRLPATVADVRDAFVRDVGSSDFSAPYVEALSESYVPGTSFTEAFQEVFRTVLAHHDLAFVDSASEAVRQTAAPLLHRTLADHAEVENALRVGAEAVEAAGYDASLAYLPGAMPLFYEGRSGRRRLHAREGTIAEGRDGPRRSLAEALEGTLTRPGSFSPSAALRPVLESWMLPVAVSVLGPGEIGYWAQLAPLFAVLDVPMPDIAPRDSWRIVERSVARALERVGARPEDVSDGEGPLVHRIVREGRPSRLGEGLRSLRETLDGAFAELDHQASSELPGLRPALGKTQAAMRTALDDLERRVDARVREAADVAVRGVRRAAGALYPDRQSQERVASPFPFLVRYGSVLIDALVAGGEPAHPVDATEGQGNGVAGHSART